MATQEEHANNIKVIQDNLSAQLRDLYGEIQYLQHANLPNVKLDNLTMSFNQVEGNVRALLALSKDAAGVEHIPDPEAIISLAPSSEQPLASPTGEAEDARAGSAAPEPPGNELPRSGVDNSTAPVGGVPAEPVG